MAEDVAELRGLRVTSVARTLVDLASVLRHDALERAVHEAQVLRLLDARAVRSAMALTPHRRGVGTLRRILAEPSAGRTRGALEERFLSLCRRAGFPLPRMNRHVDAGERLVEVDALWPRERVIVELDGAATHATARGFEHDRRRDAALTARGYVVVRPTWRRLAAEPGPVLRELRTIMALRAGHD